VSKASATLVATPSGSSAKPPSKSALTGKSVAAQRSRKCSNTSSRDNSPSLRPSAQAAPALVEASALNPSFSRRRIRDTPERGKLAVKVRGQDLPRCSLRLKSGLPPSHRIWVNVNFPRVVPYIRLGSRLHQSASIDRLRRFSVLASAVGKIDPVGIGSQS
jgi:hypothetical protein